MNIYIILGVGALAVVGLIIGLVLRSQRQASTPKTSARSEVSGGSGAPLKTVTKESGLKIETLQTGTGSKAAERGDLVSVHYTGWLTTGVKFDSSVDRGVPFEFKLGQGKVIRGWEEGVRGMKVGEKRRLTVPHTSGYGSRGAGKIPPRATLIFEVELLGVR